MPSLRHLLSLCRVSNLPTVWTNVLAAVVLAGGRAMSGTFFVLVLSMSCFYCAGMCLNDVFDVDDDRIRKPGRPIPSGNVSVGQAALLTVALFGAALGLLVLTPHRGALWGGAVLAGVIVGYDWAHRDYGWSIALMAACRFLIFLVAAVAVSGSAGGRPLLAGTAQFAYVFVLSAVARWEKAHPVGFPLVPLLLAGISLLDGTVLALLVAPEWFFSGVLGFTLTLVAQRWVRGD